MDREREVENDRNISRSYSHIYIYVYIYIHKLINVCTIMYAIMSYSTMHLPSPVMNLSELQETPASLSE